MATWERKLLDLCDDPECGYMDFHNLISKAIAEDRRKIAADVEKVLERHAQWKQTEGYDSEEENGFQKAKIQKEHLGGEPPFKNDNEELF